MGTDAGRKESPARKAPHRITRAVTGLWFRHRTGRRSPVSSSPAIRFPCGKGMSTIKDNTPTSWRDKRTRRSGVLPSFQARASPASVPSVCRNSRSFIIILRDATELRSVAVDAKNLVVKRGIGARYWAGFAGFDRDGSKRGNFSEKFRFYGEIFTIIFPRAASVGKLCEDC